MLSLIQTVVHLVLRGSLYWTKGTSTSSPFSSSQQISKTRLRTWLGIFFFDTVSTTLDMVIFRRSSLRAAGIKNEYNMLTPCESMVICNFSCVLKCSMNCSKVISPSLFSSKNRSQRVQSLPKKLDLGAMMGSEKVMKGKAKLANPFLKTQPFYVLGQVCIAQDQPIRRPS